MSPFDPTLGTCRLDQEDREMLAALPSTPSTFRGYGRPERVSVDWHRHENQGRLGSCQGNDLTSCLERLHLVATGRRIQLSRIFAYLATQQIDGLLGADRGSTITGGARLALQHGVPPEETTGYPDSYPGRSQRSHILSAKNFASGEPYKALSKWAVSPDAEDAMDWIGGGGAVSIGIAWYGGLLPRDRIVRRFRPPGRYGGHAVAVLGYEDDLLVAVNSHGDGPFRITPDAWRQMHAHRHSAMVGLAGSVEPEPIDWTRETPWS